MSDPIALTCGLLGAMHSPDRLLIPVAMMCNREHGLSPLLNKQGSFVL